MIPDLTQSQGVFDERVKSPYLPKWDLNPINHSSKHPKTGRLIV